MDAISYVIGLQAGKKAAGGGAELNIAYGDTAPEDTSKLWVKTSKPSVVNVSSEEIRKDEQITILPDELHANSKGAGCVKKGNIVYLFCNYRILLFDIETETLTTPSTTTSGIEPYIAAEMVGSKIYLFGGGDNTANDKILCFDTETETLTTLSTTLPEPTCGMASAVMGTSIFLFGGWFVQYMNWRGGKNTILLFDTETETITTLSSTLPSVGGAYAKTLENGNKLHLFGGYTDSNFTTTSRHYCFNLETREVTELATNELFKGVFAASDIFDDGTVYLIGGKQSDSWIVRYDFTNDTAVKLGIKQHPSGGGRGSSAVTAGDSVYIFGGESKLINRLDRPKVEPIAADTLRIRPSMTDNLFNIINTDTAKVEIGVNEVYKGNANNEAEKAEAALYKDGAWTTI